MPQLRIEPKRPVLGHELRLTWNAQQAGAAAPESWELRVPQLEGGSSDLRLQAAADGAVSWRPERAGLHRLQGMDGAGTETVLYLEPLAPRLPGWGGLLGLLGAILVLAALLALRTRRAEA